MINRLRKQFYQFRKFSKLPEYWAYGLAKIFDPGRKHRFVIFGQGRTGSTLLVNLLHQHPAIYCDNELLQKRITRPVKYFEGRSLMNWFGHYGFKVNPYQIMNFLDADTSKHFIKALHERGWQIVYLSRRDWFRHALSNEIAKQRGYFFKDWREYKHEGKITIDPQVFRKAVDARFKFRDDEQESLKGLNYLPITYEDHLLSAASRKKSLPRIFEFLGVDVNFQPDAPFVRSTPEDLSEIVANYQDLKEIWEVEYATSCADTDTSN